MNAHPTLRSIRAGLIAALAAITLSACGDRDASSGAGLDDPGEGLIEIAERGDVSALDALLGRQDAYADVRDSCDWTPLMKAALNGHREAAARLLAAGASVDAADKGGYTSLLLAASNNHTAVVELLLDQGAMIDAQERTQGYTPLIWAAQRGHRDSVALLLRRGADATLPDLAGLTAADHARAGGFAEIEAMLRPAPAPASAAVAPAGG